MNRSKLLILSGAAITTMAGCSSAAAPGKDPIKSQRLAGASSAAFTASLTPVTAATLTPATAATSVLTLPNAGAQGASATPAGLGNATERATLRSIALGSCEPGGRIVACDYACSAASANRQAAASVVSAARSFMIIRRCDVR